MTAKEEILALMKHVPDGLTVSETIERLRLVHAGEERVGISENGKASASKEAPSYAASAPRPLTAKPSGTKSSP